MNGRFSVSHSVSLKRLFGGLALFTALAAVSGPEDNPPLCPPHAFAEETLESVGCTLLVDKPLENVVGANVSVSAVAGYELHASVCSACGAQGDDITMVGHSPSVSGGGTLTWGRNVFILTLSCSEGCSSSETITIEVPCDHEWGPFEGGGSSATAITPAETEGNPGVYKFFIKGSWWAGTRDCLKCGITSGSMGGAYYTGPVYIQKGTQIIFTGYSEGGSIGRDAFFIHDFQDPGVFQVVAGGKTAQVTISGDSDLDGLTDYDETHLYGTNPYSSDSDNDGLSDYAEIFEYGTDPLKADTDGDSMPDGWEVAHGLNPLADDANGDLDHDGLTNLDEYLTGTAPDNPDSDGDGLEDGWEVANDTNPSKYTYEVDYADKYYYEKEEFAAFGNLSHNCWSIPSQVTLTRGSIVLRPIRPVVEVPTWKFEADIDDAATFNFVSLGAFPAGSSKLSFWFRSTEPFKIEVGCQVAGVTGTVPFQFVIGDADQIDHQAGIYQRALGSWVADGNRFHFLRDMAGEIKRVDPDWMLESILYLKIYGSMELDTPCAMYYKDSDLDCIPDRVELFFALDPEDPTDADGDLDGDGLTNYQEFLLETLMNDGDSDGDGLDDYDEIHIHHTNPASRDSDGDGLDDYWEISRVGDQSQDGNDDYNNDGVSNREEYELGLEPGREILFTNDIYLLIYQFLNSIQ